MKLAEALQERADLNRKIEELRRRLGNCILTQEGEEPAEDPAMLLEELDGAVRRLETLMAQINLTNCRTRADGQTLTELIARKDALHTRIASYRSLLEQASRTAARATRSEIKILSTVNVSKLQKDVDEMSKELRTVENTIQESNWLTELL